MADFKSLENLEKLLEASKDLERAKLYETVDKIPVAELDDFLVKKSSIPTTAKSIPYEAPRAGLSMDDYERAAKNITGEGDNFTMKGGPQSKGFPSNVGGDLVPSSGTSATTVVDDFIKNTAKAAPRSFDDILRAGASGAGKLGLAGLKTAGKFAANPLVQVALEGAGSSDAGDPDEDAKTINAIEDLKARDRINSDETDAMIDAIGLDPSLKTQPPENMSMERDPSNPLGGMSFSGNIDEDIESAGMIAQELQTRDPDTKNPSPEESRYQRLLTEFEAMKADSSIEKGRGYDSIARGIQTAGQALGNLARARGMEAGVANEFDRSKKEGLGLEAAALRDRKTSTDDLLSKLQIAKAQENEAYRQRVLDVQERGTKAKEKLANINEQFKAEKEQKKMDYKITKDIDNLRTSFTKDPRLKKLWDQGMSFDQAQGLVEQIKGGNSLAIAALGTKEARAMGEVGNLTKDESEKYIKSAEIIQGLKDKFGVGWKGEMSKKTIQDIEDINKKLLSGFTKKVTTIENEFINRAYETYGKPSGYSNLSKNDIRRKWGSTSQSPKKEVMVLMQSPDGKIKSVPESRVQEMIDKYGGIIVKNRK